MEEIELSEKGSYRIAKTPIIIIFPLILNVLALLKLPRSFTRSDLIQRAHLPTDCGENVNNVQVIAAGNGQTELKRNVFLQSLEDDEECQVSAHYKNEYGSIICAYSNNGHAIYSGYFGRFFAQFVLHSLDFSIESRES